MIQHELARGLLRDLLTMVLGDHREREIDTGRDARRRPHIAVMREDLVRLELHLGIARDEIPCAAPMRGGASAVEQARLGQHIGARADAGDTHAAPRQPLHEGARDLAARGVRHACATRDDQRGDRVRRPEVARHHFHAGRAAHGPRVQRQHADSGGRLARAARRDLEHRDRTCRIEQLEIGKDQDADHGYVRK